MSEDRTERAPEFGAVGSRIGMALFLAVLLVGACMAWTVNAKLSGAVIAHGQVVVQAQVKEIQHPDGGVVSEILVDNGDTVRRGDLLVRLDDTQIRAEVGVVSAQLAVQEGRRARLIAVRDGAEEPAFPDGFATAPVSREIAAGEARLFREDREMREVRRRQLRLQIRQFEEQVRGLEAQRESNGAEASIIRSDLERTRALLAKGLVEASKLSPLERDLAKFGGQAGEIDAGIARIRGQISEAELRIIEMDNQARTAAQGELREVEAAIAELRERIFAARDRLSRTRLLAPISGSVNDLRIFTIGGVIAQGETVMGVVPTGALVVEARVPTTDVDQVRPGQSVKLRFSAFNQRTTPEFDGEVQMVASAAVVDAATGTPYFLASVRILDGEAQLGDRVLVPGMPVEVFFQTGERTALSYFLKPFTDQMQRAFREE